MFRTTDLHVIEDSRETVGGKLSEVIQIRRESVHDEEIYIKQLSDSELQVNFKFIQASTASVKTLQRDTLNSGITAIYAVLCLMAMHNKSALKKLQCIYSYM